MRWNPFATRDPSGARYRRVHGRLTDIARADRHEPVLREVDRGTLDTLVVAERAIQAARKATPLGAGNQQPEVFRSRGRSYAAVKKAREMPWSNTIERATAARTWGAANCDEFAAMTFAHLVAEGGQNKPILRGHMRSGGHEFTLIGDPREPGLAVVADAWPTKAQAVVWRDHFENSLLNMPLIRDEVWNDRRPHPDYDLSHIQAQPLSDAQARAEVGAPEGVDLAKWLTEQRGTKIIAMPYSGELHSNYVYREVG